MMKVISVKANDDFSLDLEFSDRSVRRFDFKPYLNFPVFRELKDLNYFKQVGLLFGTVYWPNEQDISPDTLFLESVELNSDSRGHQIVA